MIASSPTHHASSTSSTAISMSVLAQKLEEAQRLERQLWSTMTEGGTDKLSLASKTDTAWTQVRALAEAFVEQPAAGWLGREKRLAAGILLSLLDASDPEHVRRLQATALTISDDDRVGARDDVHHVLFLISRGPFVLSLAGIHRGHLDASGDGDLAPAFAA